MLCFEILCARRKLHSKRRLHTKEQRHAFRFIEHQNEHLECTNDREALWNRHLIKLSKQIKRCGVLHAAPFDAPTSHLRNPGFSSKRNERSLAGAIRKNDSVCWKEPKIAVAELARLTVDFIPCLSVREHKSCQSILRPLSRRPSEQGEGFETALDSDETTSMFHSKL